MDAPASEPRKRGRQPRPTDTGAPSPSPVRRRGCNCKKSGCLKLYCECFAANVRCGDRCQCMGCKNRDHNRLEIAHAMEAIEKRTQRAFKSPIAVAKKLENLRMSAPHTGTRTPLDGATRLLMSAEKLDETPKPKSHTPTPSSEDLRAPRTHSNYLHVRPECTCTIGSCSATTPCHQKYGSCGPRCMCKMAPPAQEKTRGCSCKKSNCLKLYCECLAAQRSCDARCNCEGCKNNHDHQSERERAISAILERNPLAFQPKVASGATQHLRGCNCRKSNCMKNYCECHQAGVPCTSRCACQGCRNTETFVSAKKMLVFSGDGRQDNSTSPDRMGGSHQAQTPSSAKPPRRPPRRASMDVSSSPSRFRTPSSQPPSALELLSRTAPPAQQNAYTFGQASSRLPHLVKRKQAEMPKTVERSSFTTDKRKLFKSSTGRSMFQERLEKVAAPAPVLPSVEDTLDSEYDAAKAALPLTKLCRSLLHAASSVEAVPTPRKLDRVAKSPAHRAGGRDDGDEAGGMSPTTEDLMCEEDIETPGRGGGSDSNRLSDAQTDLQLAEFRRKEAQRRLTAMQERAVLQEFSVWLRNLTTSSTTTMPPQ